MFQHTVRTIESGFGGRNWKSLCIYSFIPQTKQESSYKYISPPVTSATLGKLLVYFSSHQNLLYTYLQST